jgi:CubicO group peptidase (beta-lactamase class C family)
MPDERDYMIDVKIRMILDTGGDDSMERTKPSIAVVLIACGFITATLQAMVFPEGDWKQAQPEAQGADSVKLEAAVSYLKDNCGSDGVNELVVIRNGCMIWKGPDIDKMHGVWSLTKSFTSTVLGLLIDDGKATLDTLTRDHVTSMAATYPDVTLRHFTTMTSGYYAVGDKTTGSYKHGPSRTPFKPAPKPLFDPPGSRYAYWDSAMNQFANVLAHIADEPIETLFKRRIADPIGMDRSKWDWGDFGKVDGIVINGGSGNSSKHMFISARELARFGHLFLNRGKWKDKQLISAEWVDAATKPHIPASMPLEELSGADGRGTYGYNWWANGIKADGRRKWPDAPTCAYSASGYNNNDMFVIPKWNMVIVRLGLDQRDVRITDSTYNTFLKKVGEAIER